MSDPIDETLEQPAEPSAEVVAVDQAEAAATAEEAAPVANRAAATPDTSPDSVFRIGGS